MMFPKTKRTKLTGRGKKKVKCTLCTCCGMAYMVDCINGGINIFWEGRRGNRIGAY